MAIVMHMEWPEITPAQYDEALNRVNWENDIPSGAIFHVVGWDNGVFQAIDVWESEEDWNRFLADRLTPTMVEMNLPGQPQVSVYPAYRIFDAVAGKVLAGV